MQALKYSAVALAAAVAFMGAPAGKAQAADYVIDTAHSGVSFTVRHLATNVRGFFRTFEGAFSFDPAKPEAAAGTITIQTASLDTNHARRDQHLHSGDFFEVDKFPTMTYAFTSARKDGDDYILDGELTIRDETRKVPLRVQALGENVDPWGNRTTSFSGTATVDRKDFGLNWNKALEAGGLMVGDTVNIQIDVAAHPAPTEEAKAE